jgi:hypothetical protein
MYVQDAVGKGRNERWRDDAHIAGKTDEVDLVLVKAGDYLDVMFGAFASCGGNSEGRKIEFASRREAVSVFNIREHNRDLSAEQAAFTDRFGNGKKVRASAGEEDTQALH